MKTSKVKELKAAKTQGAKAMTTQDLKEVRVILNQLTEDEKEELELMTHDTESVKVIVNNYVLSCKARQAKPNLKEFKESRLY